jgi:dUTP pyrophosphatase
MLPPGGRAAIGTGIALQLPSGFEGQIRARSGLALHRGLTVLNGPGTIDPGYRGEVSVILVNLSNEEQVIKPGDRIAQLVVAPCAKVRLSEVGDLDSSARGEGGFGSSGT